MRVPTSDHDVLVAGAGGQRRDHILDLDPTPLHRVRELVQNVEAVRLGGEFALDLCPALGSLGGVIPLGAGALDPRPALTHLVPDDRTALAGALVQRAERP